AKRLHLKLADFGITFQVKPWGVALSVLLPAFVVIAFLMIGELEHSEAAFGDMVLVSIASIMTALKAGILEEMLFRGFIMRLLEKRWSKPLAILLPSFLFSLAHIPAMESFTVGGVVLLVISGTLVGVMFSLIAYRGNSISNSVLIHSMWNLVMVTDILHITTAQGAYGRPLIQILIPSDNILLTGAGFGAEASLIAMIGYLLVCRIVIWKK
ncbi:MAG: CPBP family intramembrane metalloprotease, partial [Lachnospiraceae bacterium]|nr:CPBP family intramembrane metalloprotease [Lachnospiraceae bacterium]